MRPNISGFSDTDASIFDSSRKEFVGAVGTATPLFISMTGRSSTPTEAVQMQYLADVVALGDGASVATVEGTEVTFDLSDPQDPRVNGASIIATDIVTENGVIHLISSWNHYAFNLKWLTTPPPALRR